MSFSDVAVIETLGHDSSSVEERGMGGVESVCGCNDKSQAGVPGQGGADLRDTSLVQVDA